MVNFEMIITANVWQTIFFLKSCIHRVTRLYYKYTLKIAHRQKVYPPIFVEIQGLSMRSLASLPRMRDTDESAFSNLFCTLANPSPSRGIDKSALFTF